MSGKPQSIDEYLATVSPDRRSALETLRKTIRRILPEAEECISYSMPAFRYGGSVVAGFLATAKGCSFFPFSGTTLSTLASELAGYGQTKSALHFDPKRPLSATLVRKLLEARIAETKKGAARAVRTKRGTEPNSPSRTAQDAHIGGRLCFVEGQLAAWTTVVACAEARRRTAPTPTAVTRKVRPSVPPLGTRPDAMDDA